MNQYDRAFRAIDDVIAWTHAMAAPSHQERMARVDAEADKLRAYIDSRRAQLEAQSSDPRFLGVPVREEIGRATLTSDQELDEDGPGDADERADDRDHEIMTFVAALLGVFSGAMLAFALLCRLVFD